MQILKYILRKKQVVNSKANNRHVSDRVYFKFPNKMIENIKYPENENSRKSKIKYILKFYFFDISFISLFLYLRYF